MSEFWQYNRQKMHGNKVTDVFTGQEYPVNADLSEECTGTIGGEELLNDFHTLKNIKQETPKKKPVEPFKRKSERSLELLFDF